MGSLVIPTTSVFEALKKCLNISHCFDQIIVVNDGDKSKIESCVDNITKCGQSSFEMMTGTPKGVGVVQQGSRHRVLICRVLKASFVSLTIGLKHYLT